MNNSSRVSRAALIAAIALSLCVSASHAGDIGLRGIEARIGLASLEGGGGSTFIVSGAGDLGWLGERIGLEANIDFWTKSWDENALFWDEDWSWSWTNVGFLGNVRYFFPTQSTFHPFAFGGLGLHYWNASWDCKGCEDFGVDRSTSGIELGLDVGAGAEFGSGDGMKPVVRAGFNTNGGADYLFIQGGLKFPVGKKN